MHLQPMLEFSVAVVLDRFQQLNHLSVAALCKTKQTLSLHVGERVADMWGLMSSHVKAS